MTHTSLFIKGNSAGPWAQALATQLGVALIERAVSVFSRGELHIKLPNVEGTNVFILQGCFSKNGSVNDSVMEVYLLSCALKRGRARTVTLLFPEIPYGRQDGGLSSDSGGDVARLLEASGVDTLIALDVHSVQFQKFFHKIHLHNLSPWGLFAGYLVEQGITKDRILVAPDQGSTRRVAALEQELRALGVFCQTAQFSKTRDSHGHINHMELSGAVAGQDAVLVDDLCDSAETLIQAALILKRAGATRVIACVTHVIASENNLERLFNSPIEGLITTDSVCLKPQKGLHVLPIAPMLCNSIAKKW